MPLDLQHYLTLSAVLVGFQLTALAWRISREIEMAQSGETTWFPVADLMNVLGMSLGATGVFVLPLAGVTSGDLPRIAFGGQVIVVIAYPWALAGHYDLLWQRTSGSQRPYATFQEKLVVAITACAVIAFIVAAICRG